MRPVLPGLLALLAVPALANVASARPITVGAALGITQSKVDANADPNTTLDVFGRLGLNPRLGAQLELQRIQTDTSGTDIRTGTVLLAVDLGSGKHLVPMILAGAGLDSASSGYDSVNGTHIEGGFSLEYRADGGLVIGGDLRMGGRSIDQPKTVPLKGVAYYAPSTISDGEYRAARAYVGVRF
ncbi:MAG: hypothetical protein JO257_25270 [Deltaproteobacteria bacterium]|nr:hypothetical protein [Deltaproteobacteria bacterium]